MATQGAKNPTKEYLIYHCQPEAKTTIKMGTKNTLEVKREKGMWGEIKLAQAKITRIEIATEIKAIIKTRIKWALNEPIPNT